LTKIREDVYLCDKLFKYMCLFFPPMRNQRRISGLMKKSIFFISILFCISQIYALQGAKYLIIAPDNFVQAVQPLADWKTKKGVKAKIVPLSITGSSASQIKTYIANAYNTWELRPQYILLAGFGTLVPASGSSDDYYVDISGNYRIELSVGRLPFTTLDQCNMLVAKILGYERTPYINDTLWFRKGTTIVNEDGGTDPYYQADCRYIRNLMLTNGFVQAESLSDFAGHNSTTVMNSINDGRSYLVYRGSATVQWYSPFNAIEPNNLTNGFKLPIIISGTCVTISLTSTGYYGDRFLNAGTAQNPKGAVAYFGTTAIGTTVYRSVVSKGFFQSVFTEGTYVLGDATKRAKFILDSLYNNQSRYTEWNLFGDPELNLWTSRPRPLTVTHDTIINTTPQMFNVNVSQAGLPVSGASVCVMMDTIIYQYGSTDNFGNISFNVFPHSNGIMSVTVTAQNCIPYEKNVNIIPGNLTHDVGIVSLIEPVGTITTGTNIIPKAQVKNFGINTDTFPVTFTIGNIYTEIIPSVLLAPGDTLTLAFPEWSAIFGNHSVKVFTGLDNDEWRGNDTAVSLINVVMPNDVGVDAILSPDSIQRLNVALTPKARIKNYGSSIQTNFNVTCSIIGTNGAIRYSGIQLITLLAPDDTIRINFANWMPTIAEQCSVKIRTNLVNDQNPANDCKTKTTNIINNVQIIIGTGTATSYSGPMNRYYNYSSHEVIYLQSEINILGTITSIAYYKENGSDVNPIENVVIYMKHTTSSTLGSGTYSLTGYTEVFNGSFTNNATEGWMEVPLSTPFEYNNTDNLQILILKGYQAWISTTMCPYWRYTTTPTYQCRQASSQNGQPTSLTQTYYRPNVMLTVTTFANDIGVMSILYPDSIHSPNTVVIPQAKIKNYGSLIQTNFPVVCSIFGESGSLRYYDTLTVSSLAAGDTSYISFRLWVPTITELCTVKVRTNLIGDQNPANNQKTRATRITAIILAEGFNSFTFPPSGWQSVIVQGAYNWQRTTSNTYPNCTPFEGQSMASYPAWSAPAGSMARLISPPITLGASPIPCSLKFCMFHDTAYSGNPDGPDSLKIEYSFNDTNFNRVAAFRRFEPVEGWIEHSVYLGTFSGMIYIGLLAYSEYGDNMNIDYVRIASVAGITEENTPINNISFITALYAPKPNPISNGYTKLNFTLAEKSRVSLKIYDVSGKLIKTLVNAQLEIGRYNYLWEGKDEQQCQVAKGIYFATLETQNRKFVCKMVYIR